MKVQYTSNQTQIKNLIWGYISKSNQIKYLAQLKHKNKLNQIIYITLRQINLGLNCGAKISANLKLKLIKEMELVGDQAVTENTTSPPLLRTRYRVPSCLQLQQQLGRSEGGPEGCERESRWMPSVRGEGCRRRGPPPETRWIGSSSPEIDGERGSLFFSFFFFCVFLLAALR